MPGISPINGPHGAATAAAERASNKRSLLDAAGSVFEDIYGESNARATEAEARRDRPSAADPEGRGSAIDVTG